METFKQRSVLSVLGIKRWPLVALGGSGAFLLGAGGRCPWGPEKMQPELGGGSSSSGRSGWTTATPRRNEGITVRFQSCWEGTPFPPTGSQKLGLRPSRGTWRCPAGLPPPPPAAKSRGLIHHQHIRLLEPSSPILFLLPLAALWKLKGYLQ